MAWICSSQPLPQVNLVATFTAYLALMVELDFSVASVRFVYPGASVLLVSAACRTPADTALCNIFATGDLRFLGHY